MREEPFQRIGTKGGLDIFAVRNTTDGTDVIPCCSGNIFESHWPQQSFIAFLKEWLLEGDNCLHGAHHCFRALLEGIDEHLSAFHVLANEGVLLSFGIRADDEGGLVATTQGNGDGTILVGIDKEVGLDALCSVGTLGTECTARPWIEFQNFPLQLFDLCLIDVEALLQPLPTFVYEVIEILTQHLDEQFAVRILLVALNLYEQAFLQRACSDAWRIELLEYLKHFFQLLGIGVETLVDFRLVGEYHKRFLEQSVLVERPNEVLHEFLLVVGEVEIGHLLP